MENKYVFITFLFFILITPLFAQGQCFGGSSIATLDANNTRAVLPMGALWTDNFDAGYFFPKSPIPEFDVATIFAGGLWFGGLDPAGNLKLSASTYNTFQGHDSYWPGPLDENTGLTNTSNCILWDRHFETTNADVVSFLQDWEDGSLDQAIPNSLLSWPARGNPHFVDINGFELPLGEQALAPFFDNNEDGWYDPLQGDYPSIKGATQAIWWVMNNAGNTLTVPSAQSPHLEIQMMAYAYASSNTAVNNTTFYDVKYINRAFETLDSMAVSIWLDPQLGCFTDDYIGCKSDENMAYFYNQDAVDGEIDCFCPGGVSTYCSQIPVMGIKLIKGPLTERLKDGTGGGTIPPFGVAGDTLMEVGLSSVILYNNAAFDGNPIESDPNIASEYYNYMNGRFRDNSPILNPDGDEVNFMFDGNPANGDDWTMCASDGLASGDKRILMNIGSLRLHPGQTGAFTYCITGVEDVPHPCPDITVLSEALEEVGLFVESNPISTSIETLASVQQVSVYPNPMAQEVSIELKNSTDQIEKISLFSLDGRLVKQVDGLNSSKQLIERDNLTSGMYFYQLTTTGGQQYTGKLVMN